MAQSPAQQAVYVNFDKLTLYTNVENSEPPSRARLVWSTRNNNPRITLFYKNKDGLRNVAGGFDQVTFLTVLNHMEEMIKNGVETKQVVRNFIKNKETGNMDIMSELWYGLNAEGVLWLAVTSEKHPRIKFEVRKSDWHLFLGNDGKDYPLNKLNLEYSSMYLQLVKMTFEKFLVTNALGAGMEAVNPDSPVVEDSSKPALATSFDELESF